MNRKVGFASASISCLSHASGNESVLNLLFFVSKKSVPREWECIVPTGIILGKDKACPACVGMNLVVQIAQLASECLSHASGNESGKVTFGTIFSKFIPRE